MNVPLYAVGVGPGDPELLTLKAARLIRAADVIVAPAGADGGAGLAQTVIADLVDAARQQLRVRTFPMTHDREQLNAAWFAIAAELAELVQSGQRVVFVTLGDPLLYSTFIYLYEQFQAHWPELPVEIVPGITSFCAAAATSGVPLVQGAQRLVVAGADIPADELRRLLAEGYSLALLKVARLFPQLRQTLRDAGLEQRAVFARRVGQAEETVTTDLSQVTEADLDYFSLVLVRP